jgi:hypothetical protein
VGRSPSDETRIACSLPIAQILVERKRIAMGGRTLSNVASAEDFEEYLRTFTSWGDDEHIYDFNLIVHLLLALLDNIRHNATEGELEDIGHSFMDSQRRFLTQLADYASRITNDEMEEEE